MYILASMERPFKFRLNDTKLFLSHSVLNENADCFFFKSVNSLKSYNQIIINILQFNRD